MGVFRFEGGAFEKVAGSMDEYATGFARWDGQALNWAHEQGMSLLDEMPGVFELYARRPDAVVFSRLGGIRWWVRMADEAGGVDDVLIADHLPDYLAFMALLRPLTARMAEVRADVERELAKGAGR